MHQIHEFAEASNLADHAADDAPPPSLPWLSASEKPGESSAGGPSRTMATSGRDKAAAVRAPRMGYIDPSLAQAQAVPEGPDALAWGIGWAEAVEIDQIGILPATRLAMARAVEQLGEIPQYLLVDGNFKLPELPLPQQALIKGDRRSLSIAAASVLAKTARDSLLVDYEADYPGYGFARHKGYGTALHQAALQHVGPCAIHRRSFAPLRCFSS